ncbi:hypothetical protein [Streptomyces goshikiensis]
MRPQIGNLDQKVEALDEAGPALTPSKHRPGSSVQFKPGWF